MSKKSYQICSNCIMDTSDPNISFDDLGLCDYCRNYQSAILPNWHTDSHGYKELMQISGKIKKKGKGKDFDCVIGLSGGLDSSYVAYVAKEVMGLKPLLIHVDGGWNTQQAVSNIEKIVDGLGFDLYTEVINWEEMKDLQLAFFKSQIPDQDLPQDYAFFSALYKFAKKHKVSYILTGSNYSTECCREPEEWGGYLGVDKTLVNSIHKSFSHKNLKTFPIVDVLTYKIIYGIFLRMKIVKPLNLVSFIKKDAEAFLEKQFGWEKFKHKHHESRFTRFYEAYWLPRKFGFEKRRAHFSSLILTNQMNREDALNRISKPELDELFLQQEFVYIAKKLEISKSELTSLFYGENKTYKNYRSKKHIIEFGTKIMRALRIEKRFFR